MWVGFVLGCFLYTNGFSQVILLFFHQQINSQHAVNSTSALLCIFTLWNEFLNLFALHIHVLCLYRSKILLVELLEEGVTSLILGVSICRDYFSGKGQDQFLLFQFAFFWLMIPSWYATSSSCGTWSQDEQCGDPSCLSVSGYCWRTSQEAKKVIRIRHRKRYRLYLY